MDSPIVWLSVLLMALAAYGNRAFFILLAGRLDLPAPVRRALRYVPPSVLTALIVPSLALPTGTFDPSGDHTRLVAGILAWAIACWTRNVLATILAGMAALHLLRALSFA